MKSALLLVCSLSLSGCVLSARILAVLPFTSKSHSLFYATIFKILAQKGHQVVVYSPFPPDKQMPNYTHFEIHTKFEEDVKEWSYEEFLQVTYHEQPLFSAGMGQIWDMTYVVCEEILQLDNIQILLKSKEHFDLVMVESTFGQESLLLFGHKFSAPTITIQGLLMYSVPNRAAGNALSIATLPDTSLVMTDQMTFKERFYNLISTVMTLYTFYNRQVPNHDSLVRQYYSRDAPSVVDMIGNVSLYFINAHPAIEYTRPYTPNIIPLGGITIPKETIVLPQNLQKFMDESKEGVVYFSLGTVVPAHVLPSKVLQIFVNAFKKLKHRVLWKINLEKIPGISDNVMLVKWVPQPSVLAHPNCAVFITHGGLFSQQEAIYAGVPTVSIPFFGDQLYNVRFSEHRGIGVKLDFRTLSEEAVISALNMILSNSKYKENTQALSRVYRDRIQEPADTLLFWVEYVIRHRGAHHLKPEAARLAWYQLALLDVLTAVILALLIVLTSLYLIISRLLGLVFSRKPGATSEKKKK